MPELTGRDASPHSVLLVSEAFSNVVRSLQLYNGAIAVPSCWQAQRLYRPVACSCHRLTLVAAAWLLYCRHVLHVMMTSSSAYQPHFDARNPMVLSESAKTVGNTFKVEHIHLSKYLEEFPILHAPCSELRGATSLRGFGVSCRLMGAAILSLLARLR